MRLLVSFVGDARGAGTVTNLSSDGCKIESEIQFVVTQLLVLRIAIPHESEPIAIDVAAVRWSNTRACGVQFVSMKTTAQQRLDGYLAALPPS